MIAANIRKHYEHLRALMKTELEREIRNLPLRAARAC